MDISIIQANNTHLDQLAELLMITSYDKATAKYNTLNLDINTYIKEYKLIPLLNFTSIAVNKSNPHHVLGMIVAAPLNLINENTKISYSHPNTKPIFEKFYEIYENEIPMSYNIFRLAVNKKYRGNGIGKALLIYAEEQLHKLNLSRLTVVVWNCQVDAICLYLKFGMEIKQCYHISDKIPYPTLLYLEKDIFNKLEVNYFETNEFSNLELM